MLKYKGIILVFVLLLTLSALPACTSTPSPAPPPPSTQAAPKTTTAAPAPAAPAPSTTTAAPPTSAKPSTAVSPSPTTLSAADFFKDKAISLYVGDSVGTDDDLFLRLLAPALTKYLGASKVTISNKAAGGGLENPNYLFTARNDGLEFGSFMTVTSLWTQIMSPDMAKYKADQFTYLGFGWPNRYIFLTFLDTSNNKSLDALKAAKGLKAGASASFDSYGLLHILTYEALNLDVKLISGMSGSERVVALGNKQIDISAFGSDYLPRYSVPGQKLIPFIVGAAKRSPDYPDCPTLSQVAPTTIPADLKNAINFMESTLPTNTTFIGPPGMAPDRAAFISDALFKALKDTHAEAEKVLKYKFVDEQLDKPAQLQSKMKQIMDWGVGHKDYMVSLYNKFAK